MSTTGERKCALMLVSLHKRDRKQLLARLPAASAATIRVLITELERLSVPVSEIATSLLADEVHGLTSGPSLDLNQLARLSQMLPAPWFARVLSVWTGIDPGFCLALLDPPMAIEVKRHLATLPVLPPKMVEALRAEAMALAKEAA